MKVDHIIQDELIRFSECSYEDEQFYLYLGANALATVIIPNRAEIRADGAPLPAFFRVRARPVVRGPVDKLTLNSLGNDLRYCADGGGALLFDVRPSPRSLFSPTEIAFYVDGDPAFKMHEANEFFIRIMRNTGF